MTEGEMREAKTWSKTYGWGCGDECSEDVAILETKEENKQERWVMEIC